MKDITVADVKNIEKSCMDEKMEKLLVQVKKVIVLLEQRLENDPDRPILKTLYERYTKAEEILLHNKDIEIIRIKGGCRAYLDSFSDYMNNPLLFEMNRAEELLQVLLKGKNK